MNDRDAIERFLADGPWAVAGASQDRAKYGNKVLRCYLQAGKTPVYPVNPTAGEVEGLACHPDLASVPEPVRALSIITPPPVTERVVREALELGVEHLWMQPGAESAAAVRACAEAGASVIHGGPCLLVVLGFRE
jgi:predicted CoA-binding protein